MSSISAVNIAESTEVVNNIIKEAQKLSVDQAARLMKISVETAVGKEYGKGNVADFTG